MFKLQPTEIVRNNFVFLCPKNITFPHVRNTNAFYASFFYAYFMIFIAFLDFLLHTIVVLSFELYCDVLHAWPLFSFNVLYNVHISI